MGCGGSDLGVQSIDRVEWRGKLTVQVVEATLLEDLGWIGKQNPYARLRFGEFVFQTKPCDGGGQLPTWGETFYFSRTNEDDCVHAEIWNKNLVEDDQLIAEGGFSLLSVRNAGYEKKTVTSTLYHKGKRLGELKVVLSFDLSPSSQNHPEVLAPNLLGSVWLYPKQGKLEEDASTLFGGNMKPIIVARLGDQIAQSQPDMVDIKNPRWNDEIVLKRDRHELDTITLEVRNFDETIEKSKVLAIAFLSLTPTLVLTRQRINLKFWHHGKYAGYVSFEYQLQPEGGQAPGQNGGQQQIAYQQPRPPQPSYQQQQPAYQQPQPVAYQQQQPVYQQQQPVYQQPQPVYVQPQPVFIPAPQPVYQQPQPMYQQQQAVFIPAQQQPVYVQQQPMYQQQPQYQQQQQSSNMGVAVAGGFIAGAFVENQYQDNQNFRNDVGGAINAVDNFF